MTNPMFQDKNASPFRPLLYGLALIGVITVGVIGFLVRHLWLLYQGAEIRPTETYFIVVHYDVWAVFLVGAGALRVTRDCVAGGLSLRGDP